MTRPPLATLTLSDFVAQLAAKQPVPGGGAAASVVLAQAAALGSMVIAYSVDKPALAAHKDRLEAVGRILDEAREEALELADRDADAYMALNTLWRLPKAERSANAAWAPAVDEAIAAPSSIADLSLGVLAALRSLDGITSPALESDRTIARRMAHCAFEAALANVEVNIPLLQCADKTQAARSWVEGRRKEASVLALASHPHG